MLYAISSCGESCIAIGFSVSASANSALAAYQDPANLPLDLGFKDTDGQQLHVSFPSDGKSGFLWSTGVLIFPVKPRGKWPWILR